MKAHALAFHMLLAAASAGLAQDMAELEGDHSVNSEFVTPHTNWAKPYALGKTRVLFFVNGRGGRAREVIELKQRFDFEPQMVFWGRIIDSSKDDWHGGERGIDRMARLLAQEWDAFVFIGIPLAKMPMEQQYSLIKAVVDGAGLVLIGSDDKRVLKKKNNLEELPGFLHDVPGAKAFTIRNGRGVRLPGAPSIPYRPGWEVAYDEWDMRVGKAILWAGGKEPKLRLTLTPRSKELNRATLPGTAATLRWRGASAHTVAEAALRRDDGAVVTSHKHPLNTPEGAVELDIPVARAGTYVLDVIARAGKDVAGFGSVSFHVVSPRKVEKIKLTQDWAEIGERLGGQAVLSGESGPDARLRIRLLDRRGRELARRTVAPKGLEAPFEFVVKRWFPMLLEVRATLMEGAAEVASTWRYARVVKRRRGRFNFIMWDIPRGNLAPWVEHALADTGVTVHLDGATPPACSAAYEMAWIPYTTHLGAACKPVCWAGETGVQAYVDRIVEKHVPTRRHGVFAYSLGDEIKVRGSCTGPHCMKAYRQYLREQYRNITALNASWGSDYTSFGNVQLSKPDDNDEKAALQAGNFPRWFDRQAFQSYNFCKLCERFGKAFRRIDPQSRCGFEGAGRFKDADDLDGFVRSNTFWAPYPGTADEVLRSIAPRDFPRANWMGYTKDADTLLEKYWRMVTRGCDAVWWWRWEVIGRFHGWLAPTLDPYPAVKDLLRDTQIVRNGLGDLLINSEMQTDGIGILYSLPSGYAAKVQSAPSFSSYERCHTAFHHALRELGLNFLYFTDRQMRLAEVNPGKFKIIILPMTQALGKREAEMLRQFVRKGGLLIADVRPAIYDEHVKLLAAGQLDDVFGIKRVAFAEARIAEGQIRLPGPRQPGRLPLRLQKIRVDTGVAAAGARAQGQAGDTPLFLINTFGKGQAVLLNMTMATYPSLSADTTGEAAAIVQALLARGSVTPALRLTGGQGQRLRNVETTRWVNGPVQMVSLFRHSGQPEPAKLRLPQAMFAYDLKHGKALGRQQTVSLNITPYRALFLALSRRRLKPLTVEAEPAAAPGSVQHVRVFSALKKGQQAVKLQVKLPDGQIADWVDSVLLVDKKGATVDVPIAFNDPKGVWTVRATDLYTGRTTHTTFTVK